MLTEEGFGLTVVVYYSVLRGVPEGKHVWSGPSYPVTSAEPNSCLCVTVALCIKFAAFRNSFEKLRKYTKN